MKKIVVLLLFAGIVFCLCSCSLIKNPIGEEYSYESYITLENKVSDRVTGVNLTSYFDGESYDSTGISASEGEDLGDGIVTLCVHKDNKIREKDLKNFSIKVSVTEKSGSTVSVDSIAFPLELGTDYQFELTYQNDSYLVRRVDYQ